MLNERIRDEGAEEQIVGEITHGPFASPLMSKIFKRFGKGAFGRSSACAEFESFLKQIGASGKCCLEIGTFHGITAVLLSQFFERVVCVSIDEMPVMKREIVEYLGIKNIAFYDAKDNAEKARFIHALDFDFAYSDGDHAHDTFEDFELVRSCGRVLQHEAWPLQGPVWRLLHELPQDELTWAKYDCLCYWEKKK